MKRKTRSPSLSFLRTNRFCLTLLILHSLTILPTASSPPNLLHLAITMAQTPPTHAIQQLEASLAAQELELDCMAVLLNLSNTTRGTYEFLKTGNIDDEASTVAVLTKVKRASEFFDEFAFYVGEVVKAAGEDVKTLPTLTAYMQNAVLRQRLAMWEEVAE